MTRHGAIGAAEMRVVQARRELHERFLGLRRSLARPSSLAAAAIVGFALGRRDGTGVVAGMLARMVLRRGVAHLVARPAAHDAAHSGRPG